MMASTRQDAVREISSEPIHEGLDRSMDGTSAPLSELYGALVFNDQVQRQRLARAV